MDRTEKFTSFSLFARSIMSEAAKGNLTAGTHIKVPIEPGANITDLFVVGRLFAFVHLLQESLKIRFTFVAGRRRLHSLRQLGFVKYCNDHGIECVADRGDQLELFQDEETEEVQDLLTRKSYWSPLLRISETSFAERTDERSVVRETNRIVDAIAARIYGSAASIGIDPVSVTAELSRLLLVIVRELVANSINHSRKLSLIASMTMSRENTVTGRARRVGAMIDPGQDKYEFLLMDLGEGIYPSVARTLGNSDLAGIDHEYFRSPKWTDDFWVYKTKEESLLSNLFRGDLVIRRGRRSEGLFELGQTLAWFGGLLSLYTGRTEAHVSAVSSEELSVNIRRSKQPLYLPGVIASIMLPSTQLKSLSLRAYHKQTATRPRSARVERSNCKVQNFTPMSIGFFGGSSGGGKVRRRGEVDAENIIARYESLNSTDGTHQNFWNIDLKLAHNLDIDFIDALIQELCKRIEQIEPGRSKNFFNLIFTNTPRNIIRALNKRNCASFLMLKDTFCLFLDEADEPHFIGIPRLSGNIFDLEDALKLVYYTGTATRHDLATNLGISEAVIDRLKELVLQNKNSLFSWDEGREILRCRDVRAALKRSRLRSYEALSQAFVRESDSFVFRLRNGKYVNGLIDFCHFWSRSGALIDCSRLLLASSGFPLVDSIVCFMDNGDRLASVLQRLTKISNMVILDPHDLAGWKDLELVGKCVIVVDALYPGDTEDGYIRECVDRIRGDSTIEAVFALCDFRSAVGRERKRFRVGRTLIPIVSVPLPRRFPIPKSVDPTSESDVFQNRQNFMLFRPSLPSAENANVTPSPPAKRAIQYSHIELSTEFWQNVSELKILDTELTERENRSTLFYERTEKLIQTSRMMHLVTEFVADFVKNVLHSSVDVIMHPTHSLGSFLAELVAEQLNSTPLILPLNQPNYGGPIELNTLDYESFRQLILQREVSSGSPTCLILDDSILTGGSVFTMYGIASRLGLDVSGILVLLSRLKPEISEAIAKLSVPFAYLYRLHMPIFASVPRPDEKLKDINDQILKSSDSYFAHKHGAIIRDEVSHFKSIRCMDPNPSPPCIPSGTLPNIQGSYIETQKLTHIIRNLILHPEVHILDFETRIGVAYNFLDQLVFEDDFWRLLRELVRSFKPPVARSQSVHFVRTIVFILSFSRHTYRYETYRHFRALCKDLIEECLERDLWVELHELISECISGLGITLSEELLRSGGRLLRAVVPFAMTDRNVDVGDAANGQYEADARMNAARNIVATFAWSLHYYDQNKPRSLAETGGVRAILNNLPARVLGPENEIALIDVFRRPLMEDPNLRARLKIGDWAESDLFLDGLENDPANGLSYLKEAPGYVCTLKTVLRVCKADTVLLYVKTSSDKLFVLRSFETRSSKRPDKELNSDDLNESSLPPAFRERMKESLFFSSTDPDDAGRLNDFSLDAEHKWCLGGTVHTQDDRSKIYVILGYTRLSPKPENQKTAYYYWLRVETLLQKILPMIHSKYIESANAWNVQIQSLRPIHKSLASRYDAWPLMSARKEIISYAMTNVDIGDLLRRTVRMSSERVYSLADIQTQFLYYIGEFSKHLKMTLLRHPETADVAEMNSKTFRIFVNNDPLIEEKRLTFCSVPMTLFMFIAYECVNNAITHFEKRVTAGISFGEPKEMETGVDQLPLILTVANDINGAVKGSHVIASDGIAACKTAAAAVGGSFESDVDPDDKDRWKAVASIPMFKVPDALRKDLYEYLLN